MRSVIQIIKSQNCEDSLQLNFNKPWKMHKNIKLILPLDLSWAFVVFMQMVVFHHSEENTDRVKFSTLKGPLLYIFLRHWQSN